MPFSSAEQIVNTLLNPPIAKFTDQNNQYDLLQRLLTPPQMFNEVPVLQRDIWPSMAPTESGMQSIDQPVWAWPLSRQKRATTQPAKPPDYIPSIPSGIPSPSGVPGTSAESGGSQQTATLIIGGFNALLVPVSGINPSNMAGYLQTAQQLGGSNPVKPFQAEP